MVYAKPCSQISPALEVLAEKDILATVELPNEMEHTVLRHNSPPWQAVASMPPVTRVS